MIATVPPTKEYELIDLLTGNSCVALEHEHGILTLLTDGHVEKHALLTPLEVLMLAALLKSYPYYCPFYEIQHIMTQRSVEECRGEIAIALEENTLEWLMRPARNAIGRIRVKTRPLGVEIKAILETGYILVPYVKKGKRGQL